MKPPLPRTASAVPQTLHVQLEIAKAIRALAGPDEDELLRQRRTEIAALRRDLEVLARDIPKTFAEVAALALAELGVGLRGNNAGPPRPRCAKPASGRWEAHAKDSFQKAGPDDPKHPGWPAGTPAGQGGKFRPKDDEGGEAASNSAATAGETPKPGTRYAALDTGTPTGDTNGGGASSPSGISPNNSRVAWGLPSNQPPQGMPDQPAFDTSDAAVLGQGDSAEPTTSPSKKLTFHLNDDGLYVAGVTVVNNDGGLGAAVDRYLRTLDGGNPVSVEFLVEVQTANGTDSYRLSISDDKLPVNGWKSVPLTGLIKGPGVVTVAATNRLPYLTAVIAGARRVQPN
jgi:hypothetical protein